VSGLGGFLICLGVLFLIIGGVMAAQRGGQSAPPGEADERPWRTKPSGLGGPRPSRGPISPAAPGATGRPPPARVERSGNTMRDAFFRAELGQTVVFDHPQRGPVTGKILGVIHYTELWQRLNKPSEPWVPTGNTFAALWCGSFLLYEWQNRLYALDEYEALSDSDIANTFLPHARRFAQSDQTAQVTFAYPPATWTIVDIGKFEVARADGAGLRLNPGAVGRFIHARGADGRALVVEDYQSGQGGQDTAWIGWEIQWEGVKVS
jgi:hypothetical protein